QSIDGSFDPGGWMSSLEAEIVAHHLRILGIAATSLPSQDGVLVLDARSDPQAAIELTAIERPTVLLIAGAPSGLLDRFSAQTSPASSGPACATAGRQFAWSRLRSLHPMQVVSLPNGSPVVVDANGNAVWQWLARDRGGLLLVGTDLACDLV